MTDSDNYPGNPCDTATPFTYARLHDGLSDMVEGGRLRESDVPDDYRWLVEALARLANPLPIDTAAAAPLATFTVSGGIGYESACDTAPLIIAFKDRDNVREGGEPDKWEVTTGGGVDLKAARARVARIVREDRARERFTSHANAAMRSRYAITLHDAGADSGDITRAMLAGDTPAEFVEWWGQKYDLTAVGEPFTVPAVMRRHDPRA